MTVTFTMEAMKPRARKTKSGEPAKPRKPKAERPTITVQSRGEEVLVWIDARSKWPNIGELPKHVEEWVAARQLAALSDGVQRAVIRLHNLGLLVRPPATTEYGCIELCVARTDDLSALLASVGLEPLSVYGGEVNDVSPKARMGHWLLLAATPPSDRELREFARRSEAA